MYCRIFDLNSKTYYRSMAYGILSDGQDNTYIVLNPRTNCFELVQQFPDGDDLQPPLVAVIQYDQSGWVGYSGANLYPLKHSLFEAGLVYPINFLFGYPEVCGHTAFLTDLIRQHSIPSSQFSLPLHEPADTGTWHYLLTQADADAFLQRYDGFHNATLEQFVYREEPGFTRLDLTEPGAAQIVTTYGYDLYFEGAGTIELFFEGVLNAQLRPPLEYRDRAVLCATMTVTEEAVLWAEGSEDSISIKALSVKWRKI